jgi:hypothetical protein
MDREYDGPMMQPAAGIGEVVVQRSVDPRVILRRVSGSSRQP